MLAAQRGNKTKRLSLFKSLVRSGASWYLVVSRRVFIKYRYETFQIIYIYISKLPENIWEKTHVMWFSKIVHIPQICPS